MVGLGVRVSGKTREWKINPTSKHRNLNRWCSSLCKHVCAVTVACSSQLIRSFEQLDCQWIIFLVCIHVYKFFYIYTYVYKFTCIYMYINSYS